MSYREQFDQYLRDAMEGRDESARHKIFMDWAAEQTLVCEGCLAVFSPEWEGLNEDADVRCATCLAFQRGYDEGRKRRGARR